MNVLVLILSIILVTLFVLIWLLKKYSIKNNVFPFNTDYRTYGGINFNTLFDDETGVTNVMKDVNTEETFDVSRQISCSSLTNNTARVTKRDRKSVV